MTHRQGICFDKIHDPSGLNSFIAYGQSKLANVLHSNELSQILKEGVNISANAVHLVSLRLNFSGTGLLSLLY
uniref:Uncharacterized protein n=1 Tax=Arundo donax TaxID=35708 RepID=A0A0A9AA15_ARUDO